MINKYRNILIYLYKLKTGVGESDEKERLIVGVGTNKKERLFLSLLLTQIHNNLQTT